MIGPEEIAALAQFYDRYATLLSALLPTACWHAGSFMPGLKRSMSGKAETFPMTLFVLKWLSTVRPI